MINALLVGAGGIALGNLLDFQSLGKGYLDSLKDV
jgi:hypothetical protein